MHALKILKDQLGKEPFPLVIALGASEPALIDDALGHIRKKILVAGSQDFNHSKCTTQESDLDRLLGDLYTVPFLARYRLVELDGAEKLDEKTKEALGKYLENPSTTSILVMIFNKVDKRNKLISLLIKKGWFYDLCIADEQDAIKFAREVAASKGVTIAPDAMQYLIAILDKDLLAIESALEKLALACEHSKITVLDIESHLTDQSEQDVFKLARSIAEGRVEDSLIALMALRNNHENALKFLGVLSWQLRALLHIRHCLEKGMLEQEIAKTVSIYRERLKWMVAVARKKSILFHIQRLVRLLEHDAALKSVNLKDPLTMIEKIIYQSAAGLKP